MANTGRVSIRGGNRKSIYNESSGHKGHVRQKSFHDRIIRGPRHIRKTIHYTLINVNNPVRAGLTDTPEQYLFSSYWPLQGRRAADRTTLDCFECDRGV